MFLYLAAKCSDDPFIQEIMSLNEDGGTCTIVLTAWRDLALLNPMSDFVTWTRVASGHLLVQIHLRNSNDKRMVYKAKECCGELPKGHTPSAVSGTLP